MTKGKAGAKLISFNMNE